MATKLNKNQKALLAAITEATNGADGFLYVSTADAQPLADAGLVEINTEITDANGKVAVRAVEVKQEDKAVPVSTPTFEIEDGIEIPKKTARVGAGRTSVYPFDKLEIGQSFFVPNSPELQDAYKSMSSTVSSANARYTEEIEGETKLNRKGREVPATRQLRQFINARGEKDGVEGARIFRVAVDGESDSE